MKQPSREDLRDSFETKLPVNAMEDDKGDWIAEAVDQSVQKSHRMLKDVEIRINNSMEDRFTRLENMIASLQLVKQENLSDQDTGVKVPATQPSQEPMGATGIQASSLHTAPSCDQRDTRDSRDSLSNQPRARTGHPPTLLSAPTTMHGAARSAPNPTGASTVVAGQLSDALRQLSLAVDISPEKAEGMLYRPEWHSQRKLKDVPTKNLDYQKMSLHDLQYGMTCVLEHLLLSGNPAWHTYIQHMKYVSRQALSNNYTDSAFCGYDRMVVDKYLEDTSKGFAAGDIISVSSNFHAANFKKEMVKPNPKRFKRGSKTKYENEEPVEIPENWPSDICYYYNRRSCYGRCNRSHICRKCRASHRDADCKTQEKN